MSGLGNVCHTGDITVTPVEGGFMLRRVLRPPVEGRWWYYIGTLDDRDLAIGLAREFAKSAHVHAWLQKTEHTYETIALGVVGVK